MSWSGYRKFRDQLIEANRTDLYPPGWLDALVVQGRLVPVVGDESAMLIGMRYYPSGRAVGHIQAAAGDLTELRDVLGPRAEEWGRDKGCSLAMIQGREGWKRPLKEHGWEAYQLTLLKEL